MTERARVYLDTSVVSRIRDARISASQCRALEALHQYGRRLHFVSSGLLTNEVARTENRQTRAALVLFSTVIETVPWEVPEFSGAIGDAPLGAGPLGGGWTHPIYAGLVDFFDRPDAHHVFLAVRGGCRYFLTLDQSTILSRIPGRTDELASLCHGMEFVTPSDLVRILERERARDRGEPFGES